jgi:hypothetical protein
MADRYEAAVEEARRLVKRSEEDQWRLAQLSYEQFMAGADRDRWAADIGLAQRTVNRYALAWERFGRIEAPGHRRPFSEAMEALTRPIDPESEQTVWQQRQQTEARQAVRNMPPQQRAELARELLAEPEVAEQVARDPETVERIDRARSDAGRQRLQDAGLHPIPDDPGDAQTEALAEIQENVHTIKAAYRRVHDLLDSAPLDAADREQVSANLAECQKWADLAAQKAAGSASDADYRALLEEGV